MKKILTCILALMLVSATAEIGAQSLLKKIGKAIEKEVINEAKKEFKKDKKDHKSNQKSQSSKQDNSRPDNSTNAPTDPRSIKVPKSEVYTNAQFYNDGVTGAQTVIDGIVYFILADRHHAYAKGPEGSMKKKLSHVKIWGGISYKGAVYPVTCIAAGAFYREPITSVELPSTLQEIQERSFMHTQLKSVVIPASTWRIGASSFAATPIESVRMSNGVRKIEGSAFAGCYKLTRVMLPESVSKIDRNVFRNCI